MATCALAALIAILVGRQERRCSRNINEIGSHLFRLDAQVEMLEKHQCPTCDERES